MSIIITNYRNARYNNGINDVVDCEVEHPTHGWIPFTLDVRDTYNSIDVDKLLSEMKTADDIAPYVPPTQEELDAELAIQIRNIREQMLRQVDDIAGNALRWASLSSDQQSAWSVYRTQLLDVPQQPGFPNQIVWPVKPE
jgi:hypothetical protein